MFGGLARSLWRPLRQAWAQAAFGPPPPISPVARLRPITFPPIRSAPFSTGPLFRAPFVRQPAAVPSFRPPPPPFGRAFPARSPFAPGNNTRSYTTGFAHQAYQHAGNHASNAFAGLGGLKAIPAAVADELAATKRDAAREDDLKSRIRARNSAAAARKTSSGPRVAPVRPPRANALRKMMRSAPAGVAEVAVVDERAARVTRGGLKKARRNLAAATVPLAGPVESVTLSIFLYGPPAWEMDSIRPGPARIGRALIAEIRSLAALHRDHLSSVASTLETLLAHGFDDLAVVEEDDGGAGVYELRVRFPRGMGRIDVVDRLVVMGIDPASDVFKMEVGVEDELGERTAGGGEEVALFPWPAKARSPASSLSSSASASASDVGEAGVSTSALDFLRMLDDMRPPSFCR